eukprot:1144420-Pelagomonas_calceolata.AAC.1
MKPAAWRQRRQRARATRPSSMKQGMCRAYTCAATSSRTYPAVSHISFISHVADSSEERLLSTTLAYTCGCQGKKGPVSAAELKGSWLQGHNGEKPAAAADGLNVYKGLSQANEVRATHILYADNLSLTSNQLQLTLDRLHVYAQRKGLVLSPEVEPVWPLQII